MNLENKTILVTGGAGYIGSHFVNLLSKTTPANILVVDNFSQGRENILKRDRLQYFEIDLRDQAKLSEVFSKNKIDAVVHFAAMATITASVTGPAPTYEHNVVGGWNLLNAMERGNVKKIIFSSSGSVYGEPTTEVLSESHPKNPINPYGFSKWIFEKILQDYQKPYQIDSISFRYFNPSGCVETLEVSEHHKPETHVIPCIVETLLGKREKFFVYGNDFPTPDGTGIRDYIHVQDLVEAHLLGMEKLFMQSNVCEAYNLGTNKGTSVMDLIKSAEKVSGMKLNYELAPRRPGDPSRHIADASKAMKELGWKPRQSDIDEMIKGCFESFKTRV